MNSLKYILCLPLLCTTYVGNAYACDPCALYTASQLSGHTAGATSLSLSNQYSSYEKIPLAESPKDGTAARETNVAQLAIGYDLSDRLGVQVNVPHISQGFERYETFRKKDEVDRGIGDITTAVSYSLVSNREADSATIIGLLGGIKFPTGDTGALRDQTQEHSHLRNHTVTSHEGTRILNIGTGSYDFITALFASHRIDRTFIQGDLQYAIRTEGDYDYQFGNELVWSVGPGYYLTLENHFTSALRVVISGESKENDSQFGEEISHSDLNDMYVGPAVLLTFNQSVLVELRGDFRVSNDDDTGHSQTDYKLKGAVTYRF